MSCGNPNPAIVMATYVKFTDGEMGRKGEGPMSTNAISRNMFPVSDSMTGYLVLSPT